MAVHINETNMLFTLHTRHSTYQMKVEMGRLMHTYYGSRVDETDMSYRFMRADRGFSGNPYESHQDRTFSLDTMPMEFPGYGCGDYRTDCLQVKYADGSMVTDLKVKGYQIREGKYSLPGLPALYQGDKTVQTLEITLEDAHRNLEVILYYGVFEETDVITRAARVINHGTEAVELLKAGTMCLDFIENDMDLIHFYGRHGMERMTERVPLKHCSQSVGSVRGYSSHQHNPFVVLCDHKAEEDYGRCYGISFLYSGNFLAEAQVFQFDEIRFVMGIHPLQFAFVLDPEGDFYTPEAVMSFSGEGLGKMSQNFHRTFRENLCRGRHMKERRPILINSWEAAYFDFDSEKILNFARHAADLGVEMMVLDDGWFGKRDSDCSGLGDWTVNEEKLPGGLKYLADEINKMGMQFGLWFEPEMISEDSDLYRAHPDWALQIPGRRGSVGRCQFVLDFSRQDVRDYIFDAMCKVLDSANISYVKWDANRHLTDVWSCKLDGAHQGEVFHRYILGLYDFLEKITAKYPDILFEGCSGGGGRFDGGMLYYHPQIWCSDNTDAIERLQIQYGTSFGYPISAMGSHVSVCPNEQTGRSTPLKTRGYVAMSGTFGYELDPCQLTEEEREEVREQIEEFKKYYWLIQEGLYYRLTTDARENPFVAWEYAAEDQSEALIHVVFQQANFNGPFRYVPVKGLDPEKQYQVEETGKVYRGAVLMNGGYPLPSMRGDYQAYKIHLTAL